MTVNQPHGWMALLPFAVIAVVMLLRLRSMNKARRLRLETLWVVPAIYLALIGILFWAQPPSATGWALALGLLPVGLALGWYRGRTMRIEVDPETHKLSQRASPAALILILLIVLLRNAARMAAERGGAGWHVDAALVTDGLFGFALGLLSATRAEMWLRARRLLAEARRSRLRAE